MLFILNEAKVLIKSQSAKHRNKFNTSLTLVANQKAKAVTKYNGAPLTVADVQGTGVYQFWFERDTNTLQMMSGIV